MIMAVCLDDGNGMAFLGRRQSRDREVSAQILSRLGQGRLWLTPRSAELFPSHDPRITVTDRMPETSEAADIFFWEGKIQPTDLQRFSQIWIFRWNCDYPRDTRFPMDEAGKRFLLTDRIDFTGYSHETITLEVYRLA